MQNLIHHIKQYVRLDAEETKLLLNKIKFLKVKKKSYLLEEGQLCKAQYFVEKGCLRMFFINEKGIEQITYFALENWWLTDHMSLIKQVPSSFFIQAIEDTEVYCFEHRYQEELFEQLPQLEKYFRLMMQRALAASQQRVKFFYDYSKEENYRVFTSLFPSFVQRIPQYMLASYLGLTPEYLSELRKKG
jgi:CRP-like cAMP-binding protein